MTPLDYSETNIANSISLRLGAFLLSEGYLVYWHARQAVQIADSPVGWYTDWNVHYAAYMADSTFATALSSAKGLLMLAEYLPTEPRFVERPITVVGPVKDYEIQVPALSIEIGPPVDIAFVELGSMLKWWNRHLVIEGYVRTKSELAWFKDRLAFWFSNETTLTINDHDAGTVALVGDVQVLDTAVDSEINRDGVEQATYHVICNARLEYAA